MNSFGVLCKRKEARKPDGDGGESVIAVLFRSREQRYRPVARRKRRADLRDRATRRPCLRAVGLSW